MRLHLQQQADDQARRAAKVTIEIRAQDRPIYFTGTRALEVRPGFVMLDIPPLEQWTESLRSLSNQQRQRFEEPDFYELLQREIATRLRLLPATSG